MWRLNLKRGALKSTGATFCLASAWCLMGGILLLSSSSQGCFIVGDLNGDCQVGMDDLVLMAGQWMAPSSCGSGAGLVAYWKLNEGSGLLAADASGAGHTGQVYQASWNLSGGILAGALQFDGINDYMYVNGYQGITGSNPRTCTAWIKTDRPCGEIMSWGDYRIDAGRWVVWVGSTGALRVDVGGGHIFGTTVLIDDLWHHVAVTSDGSTTDQIAIYVDGMVETIGEIVSQSIDTNPRATTKLGVFQLQYISEGNYYDGLIDDVRIYNRVLSMQEIWSIAKTGTTDYACADMNMDQTVNMTDMAKMSHDWNTVNPMITINEFLAYNESKSPLEPSEILDGNGDSSGWIELHNNSEYTIDIGGWYLTDDVDLKTQWQFPASTLLQPGEYLIVFASGKTQAENRGNYPYVDPAGYLHTNFQLSNNGEYLGLIAADGTTPVHEYNHFDLGDQYGYPQQSEDISYGYYYDEARYFSVPTPGSDNIKSPFEEVVERPEVSIEGGCYENAVDVTLSCGTAGADIYYTTDGSNPTLTTGTLYTGPIHIDSLTALVAKGFKAGFEPSRAKIETYIFVQSAVAPFNSNLPIIVVDTDGLPIIADPDLKPYTDCHVVIIDTDKVTGRATITDPEHFAGIGQIRLRGESTYGINKGHYALEIQDEYGEDKDVSLLGMPAESDWILSFDIVDDSFLRNEVAFKWFRDMGHYSPRQRYVEVYFNTGGGAISSSDFKGIYVLREKIKRSKNRVDIERLDALHNAEPKVTGGYIIKCDKEDFGVTYLEPYLEKANYSINWTGNGRPILVEPGPEEVTQPQIDWIADYINEFNSVLWQNTSSSYYPGPQAKYTDYIDVISWIDRGIIEQTCADSDAFSASQFAYKDRNGKIYGGPAWDFDRSFDNHLYTDWNTNGSMFGRWYQRMEDRLEHRITLADRWFEHREDALNTAKTLVHIDQMVLLMTEAISRSHAKPDSDFSAWTTNVSAMKDWIVLRMNWMDDEMASRYAAKPPIFNPVGGYVSQGRSVVMSRPSGASGAIYYTLNGEDPRLEGGATNPNAAAYSGSVVLSKNTCIKARIKDGGDWSAMNTEVYATGLVFENLRVTELMYHPTDPTLAEIDALEPDPVAEDFEFIEFKNIGGVPINLNLVRVTDGIDFTFGDYPLAAGDYAVLVKNQVAFEERYGTGLPIAGQYTGSLDNDGEEIVLRDAIGAEIHDFDYSDGWYELTDGLGYSLTMVDPASTDSNLWDSKAGWRSSLCAGGTPGQPPETVLAADSVVINEVLSHSHGTDPDWIELYNTTDQDINIGGWFLSDNDADLNTIRKYQIPDPTLIRKGAFKVFMEDDSFGDPTPTGSNVPFGLSEGGETVYLYSGQGGEVTGLYRTQQTFDASETDVTFGRYEKAELSGGYDFVRQISPSQGLVNYGPLIPDIVITEIYYNPSLGNDYEFVELYNRTDSAVTLETEVTTETSPGVFVTEDIPWRLKGMGYEFPSGVTIGSHSYILIAKVPANYSSAPCPVYGPYDGKLDNGGEELEIQIPGDQEYGQSRYWIPIEEIDYDNVTPWPTSANGGGDSLHRLNFNTYGRDYSNWQAATPMPGN